jgi:hypothetical protein
MNEVGRKFKGKHWDTQSQMSVIEGHVLAAFFCRSALRQPVYCTEGLDLENSVIEGTTTQLDMMARKQTNLKKGPTDYSLGSLGLRYWHYYCRRNADIISAKKAVRVGIKRDDWSRLENFKDVYDDIYGRLWEADIAEKLDEPVWRYKENIIVETHAEAYGQHTQYSLLHPEYLGMVDEVGENISQKGDGNTGGQQFMVANDMPAQVQIHSRINISRPLGSP